MAENDEWIKQILTKLRKLDRPAQRQQLEAILSTLSDEERVALRRAIEMRQTKVQSEQQSYQTYRRQDAARKSDQKQAMLSRYHWLLQIIDHYQG